MLLLVSVSVNISVPLHHSLNRMAATSNGEPLQVVAWTISKINITQMSPVGLTAYPSQWDRLAAAIVAGRPAE